LDESLGLMTINLKLQYTYKLLAAAIRPNHGARCVLLSHHIPHHSLAHTQFKGPQRLASGTLYLYLYPARSRAHGRVWSRALGARPEGEAHGPSAKDL